MVQDQMVVINNTRAMGWKYKIQHKCTYEYKIYKGHIA